MIFKFTNKEKGTETYAGVLEFVEREGRVSLPNWVGKRSL